MKSKNIPNSAIIVSIQNFPYLNNSLSTHCELAKERQFLEDSSSKKNTLSDI